ncbi:unnamed protein product [Psylliodes chrysocephalus]|uniref:Tetraspanin n=1 Tax=Psylliodes chrysocephalus TaxID=3402493 RepID=A0A9P0CSG4_9CUCU|nr:unnamed protein product [Psylliodes chrysocephala]
MENCGMNLIKYLLFVFNLLFALSGLGIIISGAVVLSNVSDFDHFVSSDLLGPPIVLIVAGVVVFIIAFLGCFGAIRESYNLLMAFAGLLIIIFIVEIAVGVTAAVYKGDFQVALKENLLKSIKEYSNENNAEKIPWDNVQKKAGHGKGQADGVGGFLKRIADQIVATGKNISDALQFFEALNDSSKVKLYFINDDDIDRVAEHIPKHILPLPGTMQLHQVFLEDPGILYYRKLTCFCKRGFCRCLNPQVYEPIKKIINQTMPVVCKDAVIQDIQMEIPVEFEEANHELQPITSRIGERSTKDHEIISRKSIFNLVYLSDSDSEDQPLSKIANPKNPTEGGTLYQSVPSLEGILMHSNNITEGLKCCGVDGPTDWQGQNIPLSCCTEEKQQETIQYCSENGVGNYMYQRGCYEYLTIKIESNAKILVGVGIGIAFIEVIGIVLACWLAFTIKKEQSEK